MKHKSLTLFLVLVTVLSLSFVILVRLAGRGGPYLTQAYMLVPASSALIVRAFFDEHKFADANLRLGRLRHYVQFWAFGLGLTVCFFALYTVFRAGQWDFTGDAFLRNLSQQLEAFGQDVDLTETLPPGMTPRTMLLVYFVGGLTVFNVLPGLITGFGEEFGWRGLMFPRLLEISPWMAYLVGGLIWYAWHLPLALLVPQQVPSRPTQWASLLVVMAVGMVCTHTYLAYVYAKTRSIFVVSLAHIVMNNASASFGYFFVVEDQLMANVATVLVMVVVTGVLCATGQLRVSQACPQDRALSAGP
jgi:membrane protease YdiL (CAAX protease family)